MTPLGMVVAGLLLVVNDFRFNGLDLIPDLIGWGIVLGGLAKLAGRSPWFTAAAVAASFGVVLGIPLLVVEAGRGLVAAESLVIGVLVFGTCTGISAVVDRSDVQRTANLLRWIGLAVTLTALLSSALGRSIMVTADGAQVAAAVVVLLALAFFAWFLVFLWSNRKDPALGALDARTQPEPVG